MGMVVAGLAVVLVCGGGLFFLGFRFWAVREAPSGAGPHPAPAVFEPEKKSTAPEDRSVLLQRLLDEKTDPTTLIRRIGGSVESGDRKFPSPPGGTTVVLNLPFVTDRVLKELAGFKDLRRLSLASSRVTDAGLKELAGFGELCDLDLAHTQVTDSGLKELAGLQQLWSLNLAGTRVTGPGLRQLAGLKQLRALDLKETTVTDTDMKDLASLHVGNLGLDKTRITDVGLKEVGRFKDLNNLTLASTAVTDAGLKELYQLPRLFMVDLTGTRVTRAGVAELSKALPTTSVQH
jgi:hypothetical protein